MKGAGITVIRQAITRVLVGIAATVVMLSLLLTMLWRDRERLDNIPFPPPPEAFGDVPVVTATWFGATMLLIDDGETQILIDGFISRPRLIDIVARQPVDNDAATINFILNEHRMRRLAAIIPVHTHFDHAMDVGAIANRSSASILGSASSVQVGRGAGVPDDQLVTVENNAEYTFGEFTVRFVESLHAPIGWNGTVPLAGTIDEPLSLPAPVSEFREGGSFSIFVSHPQGSALIQGSAGMRDSALDDLQVDTVLLGVGLVEGLGRDYVRQYWNQTVTATGAKTVIPIHFDDYTRPFGHIELMPRVLDNFVTTARWLDEFRDNWDSDTELFLPQFGVPFVLYPEPDPDA